MPITRNFPPLTDIKLTNRAVMREVGLLARERIIRRTRSGQDVDGAPFEPYSARYAAQKAAAVGGPTQPNLTLSGSMLNDIAILHVADDEVEIGFSR